MCLNETYSKARIGTEPFSITNVLKQGGALSPLLFNFGLEYSIRKDRQNEEGLELNVTHQIRSARMALIIA
jgi:hypothetical protein